VLTGHGLKDPQTALENAGAVFPCEASLDAIEQAVLGEQDGAGRVGAPSGGELGDG
jgi:threonine synthase